MTAGRGGIPVLRLDRDIIGTYIVFVSVTSKQILQAAGFKSPKTLTRWAKAGIIPGPHVGTHPSGRGKIAYWPDWVLERCQRIAELLRQGHTLGSASSVLENERTLRLIDEVEKSPDLGELLSKKSNSRTGRKPILNFLSTPSSRKRRTTSPSARPCGTN